MEEPVVDNEKNGDIDENNVEMSPEIDVEPCRLCDEVGEKMFNIFEDNPEGYQLIGLIKENLPIVLYKTDPLSKKICEKCVLNLQIISSLKKRSRKTQETYVEKLKTEGDTTDKNILLFLGCTGSKLIDNGEDDDEEEDELKDEATSTDDLTILCANCKTAILDASTVNGEIELAADLHKAIAESLRKNRVITGDADTEKNLRRRKIQPLYQEFDDSLCSSLTDQDTRHTAGDDDSQFGEGDVPSELESDDSNEERPAKRRKIEKDEKQIQQEIDEELAKRKADSTDENESEHGEDDSENIEDEAINTEISDKPVDNEDEAMENETENNSENEEGEKLEEKEAEPEKIDYEPLFQDEPEFMFEPLSLVQIVLESINAENVPDYEPKHYAVKPSACECKTCGKGFKNVKLLALHEPDHMEVDVEERIDNPIPWPEEHPFAMVRNRWLTFFDENGYEEDDIVVDDVNEGKEDTSLLVENTEKTMDMSKKDEVVLVNMKPMVNGVYLGDYTKEERKAFYQCMRIGGQTKRFCPLCRYCFKDNWAIESHYFSLACHYTCRYCGMRFNKQRHRFDEHTKEHKKKKDPVSDKIFTASKVNNTLPKVIQPDKVKRIIPGEPEKPREIRLEDYASPPVITKGGFDQRNRYTNMPPQQQPILNFQNIKIKEEPKDFISSQSKTQNQAYFCRKCYKVFFKLDEFNAHSKNCDYNNYPQSFRSMNSSPNATPKPAPVMIKKEPGTMGSVERRFNGDISNAGRPVRNCVRDIGPYKDEVYIPKQLLNETVQGPPQSFICHICGTPFPTIYSRNSHMRIHKGETQGASNGGSPQIMVQQNILKQRLQQQQQHNFQMQRAAMQQQQLHLKQKHMIQQQKQHQQRQQQNYPQFEQVRIKEEPVDSFEPMVEIHEGHEQPPSPPQNYRSPPTVPRELGGGAVSLTPIVKKPALNPNILKLVENNPNISISKRASEKSNGDSYRSQGDTSRSHGGNLIKNAGGYQGPYAPTNQNPSQGGYNGNQNSYITVSPNLMPNPNDDNKSYKCSSCWEAFSNKSHLYFHKKNQCEGSRFPCPFCKKRFGTEAAYSSHIFYSHPE